MGAPDVIADDLVRSATAREKSDPRQGHEQARSGVRQLLKTGFYFRSVSFVTSVKF
jgi:hypothetical protein